MRRLERVERADAVLSLDFVVGRLNVDARRGLGRFGVGPLRDSLEEALEVNETWTSVACESASSPENGVGGEGSSCVSGS